MYAFIRNGLQLLEADLSFVEVFLFTIKQVATIDEIVQLTGWDRCGRPARFGVVGHKLLLIANSPDYNRCYVPFRAILQVVSRSHSDGDRLRRGYPRPIKLNGKRSL